MKIIWASEYIDSISNARTTTAIYYRYCYSEITFKTDPKNHDYIVEEGGARNYDPYRDSRAAEDVLRELRAKEE